MVEDTDAARVRGREITGDCVSSMTQMYAMEGQCCSYWLLRHAFRAIMRWRIPGECMNPETNFIT
jgi:hypothetical protein